MDESEWDDLFEQLKAGKHLKPRKNPYTQTKGNIMKISNVDVKKAPTETQMEMLKQAAKRPICFDEDSPELSDADLEKFKKTSAERNSTFN